MEPWFGVEGVGSLASGSWKGVGGYEEGEFLPLGPSGEELRGVNTGLVVDEGPLGLTAEAGVTVKGTEVLICCLEGH